MDSGGVSTPIRYIADQTYVYRLIFPLLSWKSTYPATE